MHADLNTVFQAAMAYVTLGRVTSLSQLYLNKFDQARIYCDPKAKAEALKLESRPRLMASVGINISQCNVNSSC